MIFVTFILKLQNSTILGDVMFKKKKIVYMFQYVIKHKNNPRHNIIILQK